MALRKRSHGHKQAIAAAAALIVGGLSLAVVGCGASGVSTSSSASATTVALNMKAGGNAYDVTQCGVTHHYTTYTPTDRIEYGGQVTPFPSDRWDVKLKVKRCSGGTFETVRQLHARGQAHGYASGVLPNLQRGYYFGRLYYYQGRKATESDKEYFLLH